MSRTINVILSHLPPAEVDAALLRWRALDGEPRTLLVYGGRPGDFEAIAYADKVQVEGAAHRTRDHQRERQSYGGIFSAAAAWIEQECPGARFVHFAEYDVFPLQPDWNERLEKLAERENADALFPRLLRVDGTNSVHYLSHAHRSGFGEYWRRISVREEKNLVLTAYGCHSFWRAEAFKAVARLKGGDSIFLELFIPSAAHHLGFRVRPFPHEQWKYIVPRGNWSKEERERARAEGAWGVHPVKGD